MSRFLKRYERSSPLLALVSSHLTKNIQNVLGKPGEGFKIAMSEWQPVYNTGIGQPY